ncbi:MAG: DNA-processing protein DprA [Kiritimatiellae bacterium]|nr:DNA-processing protein DprA [Kiritimatiellia bacterium]
MKNHEIVIISRSSPDYPHNIEIFLGEDAPPTVSILGNAAILAGAKVALFASSRCPGRAIDAAYDLAQRLRAEGRTVISGFHSPVEKECLRILLCSPHPVIICPARGLGGLRIRPEWRRALSEGRLLLLSAFPSVMRRCSASDALHRNRLVAALADDVVLVHAAAGGKLVRFLEELARWGKSTRAGCPCHGGM